MRSRWRLEHIATGPRKDVDTECQRLDNSSKTAAALALGFGVVGVLSLGFGAYMFFTKPKSDATAKTTTIVPTFTADSGGVVVLGAF